VADFPAPIVTQEHFVSIHELRDATHALLDLYTTSDLTTLMFLPSIFTTHTAYAEWVLVRLCTAATATGNTSGAFVDAQSLQGEHYLGKMIDMAKKKKRLAQFDAGGGSTKIMQSFERLRE
jgi:hypothetical protein